jgi:hypothetical protein
MVGVIAIDPGMNTGIAWGIFNPALRDRTSNWNAIRRGRDIGSIQIGPKDPYKGNTPKDGHDTTLMAVEFVMSKIGEWNMFRSMGRGEIVVACEHFEVRGVPTGADSRKGLAPVFLAGFLYGTMAATGWAENLVWIRAGQHKPYATDDRMKRLAKVTRGRCGWIRGKPHTRDAWRILAYEVNDLV